MSVKRLLSVVLVLSLILTTGVPAFAAETDSKYLEKAILQVKNVVTIPDSYKNFQYSTTEYEENGNKMSVWYLNWNNENSDAGISATVENDGYLIGYYKFANMQSEGLGNVTREAGQKAASVFLAKARPDIAGDMRLQKNSDYASGNAHNYIYKLYKNNVIVNYIEASVEVDKYTGEVTGFNYKGAGEKIKDFPVTNAAIGIDAAKKAYLEKIGISLKYYSNYDYNKKILTVFPAYSTSDGEGKAIDAKSGDVINLYNDNQYYEGMGGMNQQDKASNAGSDRTALTKEELDAIKSISNLITKEKAESILRSQVTGITPGMEVTNTSLNKNSVEADKYLWEIGFDGAYGIIDAKTGELVSFYIYNEDSSKGNYALTEAKAKEKAETFMNSVASDKFKQAKYSENPYSNLYKDSEMSEYSFNYYRQVNGIDFVGNGFTVMVNKNSGIITHYDCNWYDGIAFPSIEKVIKKEQAFDIINKTGNMELMYEKIKEGETGLVYDFKNSVGDFLVNPINGQRIGFDGEVYKENILPQYTDISGHWSEGIVKKLLENGYYLEGDKFNPNNKITQINFLRYLYSPMQAYYDDEEFYKMLISDKIVKENEKAPKAQLTRQDAAKFTVRYLGQDRIATHPEIFVSPFKDKVATSYKGYASICYALGVMKGDKKMQFNGTGILTNAEAANVIYNTLQVK